MPMVSTAKANCCQACAYSLMGCSYNQLTQEEATRAWFTDGCALYTGTTHKWTAAALQTLFSTTLKDADKRKSPQWAELGQMNDCSLLRMLDGHGHRKIMIGKLVRKASGEEVCE